MKNEIKHISALCLAATIMAACSSESYPGLEYQQVLAPEVVNEENGQTLDLGGVPISVAISRQSFFNVSSSGGTGTGGDATARSGSPDAGTRGAGPFVVPAENKADSNRYEKSLFHIFAFRHRPDDQGPLTYQPDLTRRANDTGDSQLNCLIDNPYDFNLGFNAHLKSDWTGKIVFLRKDLKNDTTLRYSARYNDVGYNFFAYHIDGCPVNGTTAHRTPESISYDITLDGTQDIMYGMAPTLTPEVLDKQYSSIELTEEERHHVLNIGNYSSYAAERGIHPEINLQHALTRLEFLAYPADKSCTNVAITSVKVVAKSKAHLTVAHAEQSQIGITFEEQRDTIYMKDPDVSKTNRDSIGLYDLVDMTARNNLLNWDDTMDDGNWQNNPPVSLGRGLVLAPDSDYFVSIDYIQFTNMDSDGTPKVVRHVVNTAMLKAPENEENRMNGPDGNPLEGFYFLPGRKYIIRLAVYGLRPIEIKVDEPGWDDGGVIETTTDQ